MTLWDTTTGCAVSHKKWGVIRAILCTMAVLSIFILASIAKDIQNHQPKMLDIETVKANNGGTLQEIVKNGTKSNQRRGSSDEETAQLIMAEADAWNNRGTAYAESNQPHRAIEAYEQAIRIWPNYGDAWYNLGMVLPTLTSRNMPKRLKPFNRSFGSNRMMPRYG